MISSQLVKTVWRNPIHIIAFGFGAGLAPFAPGTFGTLVALPIFYYCAGISLLNYILIVSACFLAGIWICQITTKNLQTHDHPGIVWDEVVGYLVTMIAVPAEWPWLIIGFLLFRIFDIWKPWPIRVIDQQVKGGLGVMLDDVIAGLFGLAIIHFLLLAGVNFT